MLTPGTRLRHYEILSPLGTGGMGIVYVARDSVLGRTVAIKCLLSDAGEAAERLLREARAVSTLNHPNICTIYEVGEHEGLSFIVMEHVEGEPLSARVPPGGLSYEVAVRYALQIADALAHAHSRGIIHRDLKSSNVMITREDRAKVLDFGLARRIDPGRVTYESQQLTGEVATIAGTVAYMAPERLRGESGDERADIWAAGVLLHEMCAGALPFTGATHVDLIAAILRGKAEPLPAGAPASVRAAVLRCLAKEPAQRFQSAAELKAALDAMQSDRILASPTRRSRRVVDAIAVLPFHNVAGDQESDYLCAGVAASLINNLSQLPKLRVVPYTLARRYGGPEVDLQAAGRDLNVRVVVNGSVLYREASIQVQVELVDVEQLRQLWGRRYHRRIADLISVEEEIAREIVESLRITLTSGDRKKLTTRATESTEAYQELLKGRFYFEKRTATGFKKAIAHLQAAIELDPGYALPYAGMAACFALLGTAEYGVMAPNDAMPRARAAAIKALEIDPTLGEAHAALGWVKFRYEWDWPAAIESLDRAIELSPNYATVRFWRAFYLSSLERHEEAVAEIHRGQALDPLSLVINGAVGWMLFLKGEYEAALREYQKTLDMEPSFMIARWGLGVWYARLRRLDAAIAEFTQTVALSHRNQAQLGALGHAYALAGRRKEADEVLAELIARRETEYVSPFKIGLVHIALGNPDEAFRWLDRACEERDGWMTSLKIAFELDPVRKDPRFATLLSRVGLGG